MRVTVWWFTLCLVACAGDDADGRAGSGAGGSGEAGASAGGAGGTAGALAGSAQSGGTSGGVQPPAILCDQDCEAGTTCAGGECCPTGRACGTLCCDGETVCAFGRCAEPEGACNDSTDCGDESFCDFTAVDPGDVAPIDCNGKFAAPGGLCIPLPDECEEGHVFESGEPVTCLSACSFKPPPGSFDPQVSYAWDGRPIIATPIVTQLDDDNCDGTVNERDTPDIVVSTMDPQAADGPLNTEFNYGSIFALSVVDGVLIEKWEHHENPDWPDQRPSPALPPAAGDLDGNPDNGSEIVYCTDSKPYTVAISSSGKHLWTQTKGSCSFPAIADIDQDGDAEVIVGGAILNGKTGEVEVEGPWGTPTIADIDGDGQLDIVNSSAVFRADGTEIGGPGIKGRFPTVADLDNDGNPEIISIWSNDKSLDIWTWMRDSKTAVVRRTGIDINGKFDPMDCPALSAGRAVGGGPPTVADFNGDGLPDVAIAGGLGYAVFDGEKLMDMAVDNDKTFLWQADTQDCTSAVTGSTVFDFDGDGRAEVMYNDEIYLRIYDGKTGDVLYKICNTTHTLQEYPVVADVDNDGQADIVMVANDHTPDFSCPEDGSIQRGVRVLTGGRGKWVRTRRIWNQHDYHVTNVNEDGTIPKKELANWEQPGLNNFRQNKQPRSELFAPDLIVDLLPKCFLEYGLVARVRNVGQADVPPGVGVGFYEGHPDKGGTLLGSGFTTSALYPAQGEDVVVLLPEAPLDIVTGKSELFAVVDDPAAKADPHAWVECRTDNNTSSPGSGACASVD